MKADILRRAEEIARDDEESEAEESGLSQGHAKPRTLAYEDEDDPVTVEVRVRGDGEDSDAEGEDGETPAPPPSPETICELAYISDHKLFERDAQTRRSKARADLKTQTGVFFE